MEGRSEAPIKTKKKRTAIIGQISRDAAASTAPIIRSKRAAAQAASVHSSDSSSDHSSPEAPPNDQGDVHDSSDTSSVGSNDGDESPIMQLRADMQSSNITTKPITIDALEVLAAIDIAVATINQLIVKQLEKTSYLGHYNTQYSKVIEQLFAGSVTKDTQLRDARTEIRKSLLNPDLIAPIVIQPPAASEPSSNSMIAAVGATADFVKKVTMNITDIVLQREKEGQRNKILAPWIKSFTACMDCYDELAMLHFWIAGKIPKKLLEKKLLDNEKAITSAEEKVSSVEKVLSSPAFKFTDFSVLKTELGEGAATLPHIEEDTAQIDSAAQHITKDIQLDDLPRDEELAKDLTSAIKTALSPVKTLLPNLKNRLLSLTEKQEKSNMEKYRKKQQKRVSELNEKITELGSKMIALEKAAQLLPKPAQFSPPVETDEERKQRMDNEKYESEILEIRGKYSSAKEKPFFAEHQQALEELENAYDSVTESTDPLKNAPFKSKGLTYHSNFKVFEATVVAAEKAAAENITWLANQMAVASGASLQLKLDCAALMQKLASNAASQTTQKDYCCALGSLAELDELKKKAKQENAQAATQIQKWLDVLDDATIAKLFSSEEAQQYRKNKASYQQPSQELVALNYYGAFEKCFERKKALSKMFDDLDNKLTELVKMILSMEPNQFDVQFLDTILKADLQQLKLIVRSPEFRVCATFSGLEQCYKEINDASQMMLIGCIVPAIVTKTTNETGFANKTIESDGTTKSISAVKTAYENSSEINKHAQHLLDFLKIVKQHFPNTQPKPGFFARNPFFTGALMGFGALIAAAGVVALCVFATPLAAAIVGVGATIYAGLTLTGTIGVGTAVAVGVPVISGLAAKKADGSPFQWPCSTARITSAVNPEGVSAPATPVPSSPLARSRSNSAGSNQSTEESVSAHTFIGKHGAPSPDTGVLQGIRRALGCLGR